MPDKASKIILKPEELQSVRACKKAICNIAKSTNREPVELWQLAEEELRAQATTLKQPGNDYILQAAITLCAAIMIYTIYTTEMKTIGLTKETVLGIISITTYTSLTITAFKITWIPHLLKILSAALGFGFTLITTLLGIYSDITNNTKSFLHYLVGIYVYYVPPCLILCGLLWWIWAANKKEQESRKEELATLHATLPFLIQASLHNEDSRSDSTKHFTARNTTGKIPISLFLTASILITAHLFHRTQISNR